MIASGALSSQAWPTPVPTIIVVPDLRRAVRAGRYRAGDLELDAYMLWGALMGAGEFRAFVRADSTDALADAYLRLFTLGTRPRGRTRRTTRR